MDANTIASLERLALGLAVIVATVVLIMFSLGKAESQEIIVLMGGLCSAMAGYWFGQNQGR